MRKTPANDSDSHAHERRVAEECVQRAPYFTPTLLRLEIGLTKATPNAGTDFTEGGS